MSVLNVKRFVYKVIDKVKTWIKNARDQSFHDFQVAFIRDGRPIAFKICGEENIQFKERAWLWMLHVNLIVGMGLQIIELCYRTSTLFDFVVKGKIAGLEMNERFKIVL